MAKIKPFCGVRPRDALAADIIAPPYDVLSEAEARAISAPALAARAPPGTVVCKAVVVREVAKGRRQEVVHAVGIARVDAVVQVELCDGHRASESPASALRRLVGLLVRKQERSMQAPISNWIITAG